MPTKKKSLLVGVDPGRNNPNSPQSKPFTPNPNQSLPFTPSAGGAQPASAPVNKTIKDTTPRAAAKPAPAEKGALPAVFRDPRTGRTSGVTVEGRTFLGLSPEEVQQVISGEQAKTATPQGAVEQSQVAQARERQSLAGQVGQQVQIQQQPMLSPLGQVLVSDPRLFAGADNLSAFKAGLGQAAIGAAALGGIGLAAGGVGAVPGAIVGFVGGFIRGFTGKLKEDANQNITADFSALTTSSKNMRMLIIDAKADPQGSLDAFNNQLMAVDRAYSDIKLDSQNNLNKFLGADTQVEMAKLENFYAPGGLREILIARMQAVLLNPKTDVSDLLYASDFEG